MPLSLITTWRAAWSLTTHHIHHHHQSSSSPLRSHLIRQSHHNACEAPGGLASIQPFPPTVRWPECHHREHVFVGSSISRLHQRSREPARWTEVLNFKTCSCARLHKGELWCAKSNQRWMSNNGKVITGELHFHRLIRLQTPLKDRSGWD